MPVSADDEHTADLEMEERTARTIWSYLAGPEDADAHALVATLGPRQALERVRAGHGREVWQRHLADLIPGTSNSRNLFDRRVARAIDAVGGRVVIPGDREWPATLDTLGGRTPFCLWVRGPLDIADATSRSVALIGSRAASAYGEATVLALAEGCAKQDITVISGAAYGIDGAAHRGALAGHGRTIAVLASAFDRPYPNGHANLVEQIAKVGAVVSEAPPGTPPSRLRFLARNRLIAALAGVAVVVEASPRSGTLNMASQAVKLARPLAAVPGPITSATSVGCHHLLRAGATCVASAAEIAELIHGSEGETKAGQRLD